jgi:hypothetical protein
MDKTANVCCITESSLGGKIVLDDQTGVVPVWAQGQTLTWKYSVDAAFDKISKSKFEDWLKQALAAWGDSAPVQVEGPKDSDDTDFTVVLYNDFFRYQGGYVLGQAFFPNTESKVFHIWPAPEGVGNYVSTIEHELGHVFGLRHWFGMQEGNVVYFRFDENDPVSIMNYGRDSKLTAKDKKDLKAFYHAIWSGRNLHLTDVQFGTAVSVEFQYSIAGSGNLGALVAPAPTGGAKAVTAKRVSDLDIGKLGFLLGRMSTKYSKPQLSQIFQNLTKSSQ